MKQSLRLIRPLIDKSSVRDQEGKFVVEGQHLVAEAGNLIDFVVYSENIPLVDKLKAKGIVCHEILIKEFAEFSDVETPQGIMAVVKVQKHVLNDLLRVENPLIVFCLGLQDPGNLGTIIRTADAVGASGVILSKGTVDLYNQKVIRSTMGSIFHLPIIHDVDAGKAIASLKAQGVMVIASDRASKKSHYELKYNQPCAILVGNEGAGLPKGILQAADEIVTIPMPGGSESLNAGISAAVILYEALRQRIEANRIITS